MIEIYNKYNKLEVTFDNINSHVDALQKCRQLKIKVKRIIRKNYKKLFTYYCATCKKRSYFNEVSFESCCKYCNQDKKLFFVGFSQTKQIIEEDISYANIR